LSLSCNHVIEVEMVSRTTGTKIHVFMLHAIEIALDFFWVCSSIMLRPCKGGLFSVAASTTFDADGRDSGMSLPTENIYRGPWIDHMRGVIRRLWVIARHAIPDFVRLSVHITSTVHGQCEHSGQLWSLLRRYTTWRAAISSRVTVHIQEAKEHDRRDH